MTEQTLVSICALTPFAHLLAKAIKKAHDTDLNSLNELVNINDRFNLHLNLAFNDVDTDNNLRLATALCEEKLRLVWEVQNTGKF